MRSKCALGGLGLVLLVVAFAGCGDDGGGSVGTTGSVEGAVTLAGQSDHRGVLISLAGSPATATTGPDGEFRVPEVAPGTYELTASRAGYEPATTTGVVVTAGHVTPVESLELQPVQGGVSGIARREGATDHAGITVRLTGTSLETTTDASGAFSFSGVAPGTYVVKAESQGYASASSDPFMVDEAGTAVDVGVLTLAAGRGGLEGVATLEGATEHGGILVTLQNTAYATLTGPTGRYAFTDIPTGQYAVVASFSGYSDAVASDQTVTADQTTSVPSLVLTRDPGEVVGVAHLEGQTNHSGILVSIPGTSLEAVTTADGSFVLTGVPAGTYVVEASHTDYETEQSPPLVLNAGATVNVGTLTLARGRGGLTGSVELAGESEYGGVLVEVVGEPYSTVSNTAGEWSLAGIPTGTYEIRASKSGWLPASAPAVTVVAGQIKPVDLLQLAGNPGSIRGFAFKENLQNHTGIDVRVNGTTWSGSTQSDGSFEILGVPEGVYSMSAEAQEYQRYDYPLVVVTAGQVTEVRDATLIKAKGPIRGVVTVEGRPEHSGVTIALIGTTWTTTSDAAGNWEFFVPVGTYGGVRATLDHYVPEEVLATLNVTQTGVANVAPITMHGLDNDVSGQVTLYGQTTNDGITVELFGLESTSTEGLYFSLQTADASGTFTFADVPLGSYRIRYSYQQDWGVVVRDLDVEAGYPVELPPVTLKQMYVLINQDAAWTNDANVMLSLNASDCYDMKVSNLSDLSDASWETCAPTRAWVLAGPDGQNTVYAQFRDSQLIPSSIVMDTILLDETVAITAVTEDTAGAVKKEGDAIHFTLDADGETGGTATVDIVGYEVGIPLYDDGTHGDTTPDDGTYETDYVVPAVTDVNNATVTGAFQDAHHNVATPVDAAGTVTIANLPVIFNVQIIPDSSTGYTTVTWDTNEPTTGLVEWGETTFYGNTGSSAGTDTSHSVTFGDGAMVPTQEYHLRIQATDQGGNVAHSSDRLFYLKPNPPEVVVAFAGIGRVDVRWEAPSQANVKGYTIKRASIPGGPYTKLNPTVLYEHDALVYHDVGLTNGQTYYYVVTATDTYDNTSDDSEEVSATPQATSSGPTYVSGVQTTDQVWSAASGPYIVTTSVMVQSGHLLAVGPGVEVRFEADQGMLVEGQLVAVGAPGLPVTFRSDEDPGAPGEWTTLRLDNAGPVLRYMPEGRYLSGNLMYQTTVMHAGDGGLFLVGAELVLIESELRENLSSGYEANCVFYGFTWRPCSCGNLARSDSSLVLLRSRVAENESSSVSGLHVGGLCISESTFVALDSEIVQNTATGCTGAGEYGGGGLYGYDSTMTIRRTLFQDNAAPCAHGDQYGGGLYTRYCDTLVEDATFVGNHTWGTAANPGLGGVGAAICSAFGNTTISRSRFEGNTGGLGSAIWGRSTNLLVSDSVFIDGMFESSAVVGGDSIRIQGCRFDNADSTTFPLLRWFRGDVQNTLFGSYVNTGSLIGFDQGGAAQTMSFCSFLEDGPEYVVTTDRLLSQGDIDAQHNYWGPATTAEMQSKGAAANISTLYDFYDDFSLSPVLYANWALGAYPQAHILAPGWMHQVPLGSTVTFVGQGDDTEDGTLASGALQWSSDLDGSLGTGNSLAVSTLTEGVHRITLTATDSDGQQGKVWVEIEVVN